MTNLYNLIAAVEHEAVNQNVTRDKKPQLQVKAPFVDVFLFQNQPKIAWHSAIPNHLCAFTNSFDDDTCAAYVYLWEEDSRFRCTLELSNIDAGHVEDLSYIPKSLNDQEIAQQVIASVVAGTRRMKARGDIEQDRCR
jgi:hypothetical protein